jgi:hypothetical protein
MCSLIECVLLNKTHDSDEGVSAGCRKERPRWMLRHCVCLFERERERERETFYKRTHSVHCGRVGCCATVCVSDLGLV